MRVVLMKKTKHGVFQSILPTGAVRKDRLCYLFLIFLIGLDIGICIKKGNLGEDNDEKE